MKEVADLKNMKPKYLPFLLQELMKPMTDLVTGEPEYSLQEKQKLR